MKPFVLLQTRPEYIASQGEYKSFLELGELNKEHLIRVRMDKGQFWKIDLAKVSGLILPGSPFNAGSKTTETRQKEIENKLFELLDRVIKNDFPFLSICYGIGLLGVYTKTPISSKYSETLSVVKIELTKAGLDDKLLKGVNNNFPCITGHKIALDKLPSKATLLASTAKCPIQMLRIKNNIYSTQFHPELNYHSLSVRAKIYKNHGYFTPDNLAKILKLASQKNYTQANKILKNFVSFYQK
ncbi:MAG: glutamine amidotransferase [Bifidobacteriaceae bacterium]|jgi:GMP synthase (glutamine-hydrolysing)|nr:glutamine amidotransferase [Bifidobacteriaceae bacterium]